MRAVERKVARRAGVLSERSRDSDSAEIFEGGDRGSSGNMAVGDAVGDMLCSHFSFRPGEGGGSDDPLSAGDGVRRRVLLTGEVGEVPMRCGGRKSSKVVLRPCPDPPWRRAGKGEDGALLWLREGVQDLERDGLCDCMLMARSSAKSTGRRTLAKCAYGPCHGLALG
ncbi:hypothetical protein BJV78DRAFT_1218580, partial [Lactifluus subvellereus]